VSAHLLPIVGELTIQTAAERKAALLTLLESADQDFVVDLSGVTELDTAGLQLLLMARREADQLGRRLTLVAPSHAVDDVLAIAQLGDLCTTIDPSTLLASTEESPR
jgi:anti-anti-sigma factor